MENLVAVNGELWLDHAGNAIRAHGGVILQEEDEFYWFGEDRQGKAKVSCYRSRDLIHWEFCRHVLSLDSEFKPVYYRTSPDMNPADNQDAGYGAGAVIERPKVLYNAQTGKYVMWMHWENGSDYGEARCAVASCDTIAGDYVHHGSFNPIGQMSRDCTLFQDDDGTAYFISVARDNADLMIYRLSDDYMSIDEHIKTLWPGQYREAPALIKREGVYYLITSACTGWLPNQAAYAYSTSLTGKWSSLMNLGSATTYDTQPAYVFRLKGKEETTYLYLGDRWDQVNYRQSSYVLLPLEFTSETGLILNWSSELHIDVESGRVNGLTEKSGQWRIYACGADQYLQPVNTQVGNHHSLKVASSKLSYAADSLKWGFKEIGQGSFQIAHLDTGLVLQPIACSLAAGAPVVLENSSGHLAQEWEYIELDDGWCKLLNRYSRMALTLQSGEDEVLIQEEIRTAFDPRRGHDSQLFLTTQVY